MKTNDNDARRIFHANLSRFMALRGIEQSDIVSRLGVSSATASDWANGKKYPRVDAMQALADLLEVEMSDLTGKPSNPPSRKHRILFDRTKELTDKQMDIVLGVVDGLLGKENDSV